MELDLEECDAVHIGAVGELVTKFSNIEISAEDQAHLKPFLQCIEEHCTYLNTKKQMGAAKTGSYANDFFVFAFKEKTSEDQTECRYCEYWKYNRSYSQTSKSLKLDTPRSNRPDWSLAMQTLALCAANFLNCAVSITYDKAPHLDYGTAAVGEGNAAGGASAELLERCVLYAFPDDIKMEGSNLKFVATLALLEKAEQAKKPKHNFNLSKHAKNLYQFLGVDKLTKPAEYNREFPLFHDTSKWFKRKDPTDFDPRAAEFIANGSDAMTQWNRFTLTGIDAQGVFNARYLAVMKRLYYAVQPYDSNPEMKKHPLLHIFYELEILSARQAYNSHGGNMLRKVFDNPVLYQRHIFQFIYDRFDDFKQVNGFMQHVKDSLGESDAEFEKMNDKSIIDAYLYLLLSKSKTTSEAEQDSGSSTTDIKIVWSVLYAASVYFNQKIRVFFFDLNKLEANAKDYLSKLNSLPCMIADGTQPLARHAAQIDIENDKTGARVWDLVAFEEAGKVVKLHFKHVNAYDALTPYVNGMKRAEEFGLDEYKEYVFKKINAHSSSASAGAPKKQRTAEDGAGADRESWYNGKNSATYHKTINGYCTFFSNNLQKYTIRNAFPESTNKDIGSMIWNAIEWKNLRYLMPAHYGVTTVQGWVNWYKQRVIEVVGNRDATSQRVKMYMFSPSSVKLLRWIINDGEHASKATTTHLRDLYSNRKQSYLEKYKVPPELRPEADTAVEQISDDAHVHRDKVGFDIDHLDEDYSDPE